MAKKNYYSCTNCGTIQNKWSGKCPDCNSWNCLIEEHETGGINSNIVNISNQNSQKIDLVNLSDEINDTPRMSTNIAEFDRTLGGGLVLGSAILIGGDPGIGKSTLLMQTACKLSANKKITYISGEESVDQIRLRAQRLNLQKHNIKLAANNNVNDILKTIKDNTDILIIDSIQTMYLPELGSTPGSIAQVRNSSSVLISFCKNHNITLILVSQVTKDGQIAGPKILEHMVDCVLYFEGERNHQFRILRTIKNRFGAAGEIGVFEMTENGLNQVLNPSELFLSNSSQQNYSGSTIFAGIEGTRPILVEIQTLVAPSYLPTPRRAVIGWDNNRLSMIVAILASRYGLNLSDKEIYLNIAGGLKINETGADLAIIFSLICASKNIATDKKSIICGEVGLSGEVRMIPHLQTRIKEAQKLGFTSALIPKDFDNLKTAKKFEASLGDFKLTKIDHINKLKTILS